MPTAFPLTCFFRFTVTSNMSILNQVHVRTLKQMNRFLCGYVTQTDALLLIRTSPTIKFTRHEQEAFAFPKSFSSYYFLSVSSILFNKVRLHRPVMCDFVAKLFCFVCVINPSHVSLTFGCVNKDVQVTFDLKNRLITRQCIFVDVGGQNGNWCSKNSI